jgi:uncharacterized 2Fe-2S/4Fe-4S cluster protein (DUF4445 family)
MMAKPTAGKVTVDLQPVGRRVEVEPGTSLLDAAQQAGVDLVASCGGIGICGTCRVRIAQGQVTPPTLTEEEYLEAEQMALGVRLACQAEPLSDVRLDIPPESLTVTQQMQLEGREGEVALQPAVAAVDLALEQPGLDDLRSDLARVDEALARLGYGPLRASLDLYGRLSQALRGNGWQARLAIRPGQAAAAREACSAAAVLPVGAALVGLAMDLGSTKLALYLVDLGSGATLARTGVMNPQIAYGEDVVSRIAYANRGEEQRRALQARLVEAINQAVAAICQEQALTVEQIVDVTAVGNTAMHHLFSGLPVEQLGAAPYVPVVSAALEFGSGEIGLHAAPGARVYMPANIAGYVGADHVSALLATQSYAASRTALLVDIGTNTEISLTYQGQVYSCSCASGPAFEGAHIRDGMRAAPGAIDRVRVEGGQVHLTTIAGARPVGICGSGILQAVAQMLQAGIIDERGVLRPVDGRVRTQGRAAEYILAWPEETGHGREIVVTRKDVNEIQLAKGAIRAGIELLLQEAGIAAEAIDDFIIAGAFGTHLDLESALRVGMFPRLPLERYHQVGNAAGVGAKEMLLSLSRRDEAARIVDGVRYIELTTHPDFTPAFVDAMYFHPRM